MTASYFDLNLCINGGQEKDRCVETFSSLYRRGNTVSSSSLEAGSGKSSVSPVMRCLPCGSSLKVGWNAHMWFLEGSCDVSGWSINNPITAAQRNKCLSEFFLLVYLIAGGNVCPEQFKCFPTEKNLICFMLFRVCVCVCWVGQKVSCCQSQDPWKTVRSYYNLIMLLSLRLIFENSWNMSSRWTVTMCSPGFCPVRPPRLPADLDCISC